MTGKEKLLSKRILATLLAGAVLGVCNLMPVYAANSGGTWSGDEYIGDNNPNGSTVVIDENNSGKNVYGGKDDSKAVTNNAIEIKDNGVIKNIYGGNGQSTSYNSVTVNGGTTSYIYGGYSEDDGASDHNRVEFKSGTSENVHGGHNDGNGKISLNEVEIKGGSVSRSVYGGMSYGSGEVSQNAVTISGGTIGDSVYGGYSYENSAVNKNTVTITSGNMDYMVYGGFSRAGTAEENNVVIEGGTVENDIYGGASGYNGGGNSYVAGADVKKNSVNVTAGTINGSVYGGQGVGGSVENNYAAVSGTAVVKGNVYGGRSLKGAVKFNEVIISDVTVKANVIGGSNGSDSMDAVDSNKVTVNSGTVDGTVTGGNAWHGNAVNNTVIINGGVVDNGVEGGYSYNGTANNNTVIINGGTITDEYYVFGARSENNDAVGNAITINGGTIESHVIGSWVDDTGNATDNTVTITNASGANPTIGGIIFGGYGNNAADKRTGNTLNIHTKGLKAMDVRNFENLNFYLPEATASGDTILTLTNAKGTDVSGSNVNVGMAGSSSTLRAGDKVNLLTNSNGITADNVTYGRLQQGVSLEYEFTAELSGNSIVATLAGQEEKPAGKTTEQSKSPVETQIAGAAFVNSGADMVAGSGIANAVQTAGSSSAEMFGASGGGNMRYKSGSYSDMRAYNLALGFAKAIQNNAGKLTYGPLLEYGWGNYTSQLDSGIRADGNTKYYGIGMIVRQDNNSGLYYEGSLRYGRMDADYASGDLIGAGGKKVYASYDSSSSYYGAHIGIGRVSKLNDTVKADIYAKLLYTHQSGDSVTLGGAGNGEVYDFDAVNSTRARLGARLSKENGERGTYYAGLAYEYEFDGEAKATVKGLSTPAPSIKGSSGMLELGYIIQNKDVNAPAVDIGFQGWSGKKQGFSGNINFIWKF